MSALLVSFDLLLRASQTQNSFLFNVFSFWVIILFTCTHCAPSSPLSSTVSPPTISVTNCFATLFDSVTFPMLTQAAVVAVVATVDVVAVVATVAVAAVVVATADVVVAAVAVATVEVAVSARAAVVATVAAVVTKFSTHPAAAAPLLPAA